MNNCDLNRLWYFLLLAVFCGNSWAGGWWTDSKLTNGLMISANVLMVADWAQTRYIADNPDYHEKGVAQSFIGSRPSSGDVNRYFGASLIVMNLAGYFLPQKHKDMFYIGVTIYESEYIKSNNKIGIHLEF
jgi:hypothetical protein